MTIYNWLAALDPKDLKEYLLLVVGVLAFVITLVALLRNTRGKAADVLLEIEEKFKEHFSTFLDLEYTTNYKKLFQPAILKTLEIARLGEAARAAGNLADPDIDNPTLEYTDAESESINRLEAALRFLSVAARIRGMSVDAGAIDGMCAYYLRVIIHDKRPELREYVERYWRTVFLWAHVVGHPWPKRVLIYRRQIRYRFRKWVNSGHLTPGLYGVKFATPSQSRADDSAATPTPAANAPACKTASALPSAESHAEGTFRVTFAVTKRS